ncbi:MAG: tetratricopeptide repeat protein, partial [Phycisphaerales bacterium]
MGMLKGITIISLLVIVLPASVVTAKSANVLLQEGMYAEEVDGDLDTAIKKYEQVIQSSSAQKFQIAQALYRQGMCYLKKKNELRAGLVFAKLIEDYSDQKKIIDKIKPMLAELSDADPAALMPSETLIYVEFGSFGKQVGTILNMLKGTPFENPFEVINNGRSHQRGGSNSSKDILAAFMNPSMMTEFKKIRGMAVGVTGISLNNPPMVVVLYPGKSEAFRSMILAMVGMVAQPGEAVEGMSILKIEDVAGVAYDEDVIIIAQPLKQLNWSVRQYKGLSSKPALSSGNKSFLKISKKMRQGNALTIWSNMDEVFEGVMKVLPKDEIPEKIRLIDSIVNIRNIDDFVASLSIKENRIALEANTTFKDGRRCLAYNLIRTPEISKAGLDAVPSEAIGLLSIVLGGTDGAQAEVLGKKFESITGLDVGREIFANIEQVTLFIMPVGSASNRNDTGLHPIVDCIGLAINSHNPQRTYNLLDRLLSVVSLVTNQSETEQPKQGIRKYQIGFVNGRAHYCYMGQINKTTVLSLNSEIVEKSLSAIKNHRSIFTTGPLMKAVNNLPETTNKLVLINVGGAIRHIDSHIKVICDNPRNPAHKILAQLARACDRTSFQYRTNERINELNGYYDINTLPPMGKVLPLLMQLSRIDPTAKTKATRPTP